MYEYKMKLTPEQKAILEGSEGETKAKVMETIVRYGDLFEATELVKVTHGQGHLVTSFGFGVLEPVYKTMDKLIDILKELHPDVDFESCETLIDDKILDSFDIVSVISEISEEFDVVIPAEEIIPDNFNSAKALYALIEKLSDED